MGKKIGHYKLSAISYLLGTIRFPIYLFYGILFTIAGFIGSKNQKLISEEKC